MLEYKLSTQNKQKSIFGGHFPTEHNGVTDSMWLSFFAKTANSASSLYLFSQKRFIIDVIHGPQFASEPQI